MLPSESSESVPSSVTPVSPSVTALSDPADAVGGTLTVTPAKLSSSSPPIDPGTESGSAWSTENTCTECPKLELSSIVPVMFSIAD